MGKRSRNKTPVVETPEQPVRGSGARARKARLQQRADKASRQAERMIKDRPPAPWDPFPLTELSIFFGIVLLVIGALVGGGTGKGLLASGLALVCFGGGETMLREHFAGYRNHAGTLTLIAAMLALVITTAVLKIGVIARAIVLIAVFVTMYPALRRGFVRKSGGQRVL